MSSNHSLLIASSSSKSEEFNPKNIVVLVNDKEQHWFKQAHVGKFWGIDDIRTL